MVTNRKEYQREYLREWRKKNPNYQRDYMREYRGGLKNTGKTKNKNYHRDYIRKKRYEKQLNKLSNARTDRFPMKVKEGFIYVTKNEFDKMLTKWYQTGKMI